MKRMRMLCNALAATWKSRKVHPELAVVLVVTVAVGGLAANLGLSIFRPFADDSGVIQSAPSSVTISTFTDASGAQIVQVNTALDATNTFFVPNFGSTTSGNDQSCASCHQPDQGFTISPENIQDLFASSGGTDALFRPNDTANDPNIPRSRHTVDDYSLILNTGVARIGKTFATVSDFTAVAADQATVTKFGGPFPLGAPGNPPDPQQPGRATLSLFRRPLVNTNVHLDSSVLWDGRASIGNMRAQVIGAAKTLLLVSPTNDQADQVAAFMLGVFTDQIFDTAAGEDADGNCALTSPTGAKCGAGLLYADGALGGVQNLLGLALGSSVPCNTPAAANLLQNPCVENVPGYDIFDAWNNLASDVGTNAGRLAVARGQEIFNTARLIVPAGGIAGLSASPGSTIHCTTCHSKRNVGNNTDATLFPRLGTDSVSIVQALATAHPESAGLQEMLARVRALPQYCLRPVTDLSGTPCGSDPGDVITTDPGRAMVSGRIADVGEFKPPILRGLTARSPYFHAGLADGIDALVDFYNARFNIGLTPEQHRDLVAFLEAQ